MNKLLTVQLKNQGTNQEPATECKPLTVPLNFPESTKQPFIVEQTQLYQVTYVVRFYGTALLQQKVLLPHPTPVIAFTIHIKVVRYSP